MTGNEPCELCGMPLSSIALYDSGDIAMRYRCRECHEASRRGYQCLACHEAMVLAAVMAARVESEVRQRHGKKRDANVTSATPTAPMQVSAQEIDANRSVRGGWTKATLAQWGVPWPPPRGW